MPSEPPQEALEELVIANRVLANERIFDGYGHVSIRHPQDATCFVVSCARAPALVTADDLMIVGLAGAPIQQDGRRMYSETPIHAAIYEARPDVNAVVHSHAYEVLPYAVSGTPLRPVVHVSGCIGLDIPNWDIREHFGETDMLVRSLDQGRSLARALGKASVALLRGHGSVTVGSTLRRAVLTAVYLVVNARVQTAAMQMGKATYLSAQEVDLTTESSFGPGSIDRMWEYWLSNAKARGLL
jgi:ribulose-5-phosphate 4-epimerase/fuculose-1-phosphate aldolase